MINLHYAYNYVYEQILNELKEKGKENITVLSTEKEYCERFDVSLTTVRRALDRLYKEKIIVKVKGKGSVISDKVRCLKMPPNRFIGVLMLPFDDVQSESISQGRYRYVNPYAQKIYKAIYNELGSEFDLLIDTIEADSIPQRFAGSVLDMADKILVIGEIKKEVIEYLHARGKCVVAYNFFEKGVNVARVNNDERQQYKNMTELFVQAGHTKIACINGVNVFSESIERYMGFQDAMIMSDLYIENKYVRWGDMTPESGYTLTKELLALADPPTAIVCVNDGVAIGAYDAIEEAGLTVGKDIALSGHDNCPMPSEKYLVTTIDPDYEAVGKKIVELLRRDTWIDDEYIIPGKMIIR
ncbi:MAG: substrate-binding domain-containing protein [Clostridia bacterium]|nr:substrate-binding domain-containing protein [Clostridia bacterium]